MPRNPYAKARQLTAGEYAALLEGQKGRCAICGAPPKTRRLDHDHDHRTGKTRGLLCHRCNRTLAPWVTPAWLASAYDYLTGEGATE